MKVPKPKNKQVKQCRLSSIEGVRDIQIGPATVEARRSGNAHVTGKGADHDDSGYADVEERRKRFGFLY